MSVKAIVTDIDGTITDKNQLIDVEVIKAFRKLEQNGIKICVASGNVLPVAYAVSNYLGLSGPIIAENGGIVSYQKEKYQLFDSSKPKKALSHLETCMQVKRLFSDQWRLSAVSLDPSMNKEKVIEELKDFDIVVEETGFAIHLLNKGQNKAAGLRKAAELLNVSLEEFAAFGDSDNDKEILLECGFSTAVANASKSAKEAATYVSKEKYGAGVVEGLKKLNLI